MSRSRKPSVFQVGKVRDDGRTVVISGWGLGLCAAGPLVEVPETGRLFQPNPALPPAVHFPGLAEMGAFALRVPEAAGGLGLGLFDAVLLMEEVGRTIASGPIAEAIPKYFRRNCRFR